MNNLNQLRIPRCVKLNPSINRGSARILRCQPTRVGSLHIHLRQARYQRRSLQVTVLKVSRRTAQNHLAIAIRAIGRLTIGALNQQG